MSKTITFKPEFEAKLKKLRIKTKFVKYYKANKWIGSDPLLMRNACNRTTEWYIFIVYAFSWELTEEGYSYWEKVCLM